MPKASITPRRLFDSNVRTCPRVKRQKYLNHPMHALSNLIKRRRKCMKV